MKPSDPYSYRFSLRVQFTFNFQLLKGLGKFLGPIRSGLETLLFTAEPECSSAEISECYIQRLKRVKPSVRPSVRSSLEGTG